MKIESADFAVSNIFLDNGCEPFYGEGDAFPKKFATVNIQLSTTDAMTEVVDAIREEKGFLPMLPTEKHQTDYDMDGWYDFYLDINDYDALRVSDHIDAVVDNGNGEDDFTCYTIELSDAVRAVMSDEEFEKYGDIMELMYISQSIDFGMSVYNRVSVYDHKYAYNLILGLLDVESSLMYAVKNAIGRTPAQVRNTKKENRSRFL